MNRQSHCYPRIGRRLIPWNQTGPRIDLQETSHLPGSATHTIDVRCWSWADDISRFYISYNLTC
ncbi:hypothetical protein CORC01_07578 [Colletotrichum orchidophilum]|uniref:Uncharacterized protein n=1 Tax=Colletotrichum orchidophilum TaxID=1209926 RepID=A0A1G4B6V9_9PEZI|nr:uncharacterized protein CORC01_07578 [Colletotrichum orchidophilum]OHE97137.1 hypothetical protein CORC01_07578 [Colletotrichum orchidophilum]